MLLLSLLLLLFYVLLVLLLPFFPDKVKIKNEKTNVTIRPRRRTALRSSATGGEENVMWVCVTDADGEAIVQRNKSTTADDRIES